VPRVIKFEILDTTLEFGVIDAISIILSDASKIFLES
jgi:hypothetical protein